MIGRIWGAITAGIGAVIIVVILSFSLRLGAWVDDAQISDPTMPSPFFPLMGAMVLGAVLVVGGLIAAFGSSGTARRT